MTVMEEKLNEAIEKKNNDVKSFVWKLARKSDGTQEEIKLVDATDEQLQQFYNHCDSMLYSTDKSNPGRYVLLDIIKEQRMKCNVELFLRKLNEGAFGKSYPRHEYCQMIMECVRNNKEAIPKSELKHTPISLIHDKLPTEFKNLSIASVIDGCLDSLGIYSNKHITFSFILNLGVCLTPEEMKEFNEKDDEGNYRSKLELIKERLGLRPHVRLTVKPSGLSFSEMRAMFKLHSCKYSKLTSDQLVTLRNKVLFRLEQEVNFHIDQWEERIRQITKVAESRGLNLK